MPRPSEHHQKVKHKKILGTPREVKTFVVTRRMKIYMAHSGGNILKRKRTKKKTATATKCTLRQMEADISGETLISEHDIRINRHESERESEENDVRTATSEVNQPSTRHYDQCDMMFRIRAEPHPKRKSAPQRRIDAAENLHKVSEDE